MVDRLGVSGDKTREYPSGLKDVKRHKDAVKHKFLDSEHDWYRVGSFYNTWWRFKLMESLRMDGPVSIVNLFRTLGKDGKQKKNTETINIILFKQPFLKSYQGGFDINSRICKKAGGNQSFLFHKT